MVDDVEAALVAVDHSLSALQSALHAGSAQSLELEAAAVHHSLACAAKTLKRASMEHRLSKSAQHRMALIRARVTAQRDTVARATAALDRAMHSLASEGGESPRAAASVYSAQGATERPATAPLTQA